MEDFTIPHDSAKNCNLSVMEDEKDKVKDFVYKHFREVTDGPLFNHAGESPVKENRTSTKRDKQTLKAHCKVQQRAVFSGKILSFGCSVCKDNFTFSPNDLLKHFRVAHQGCLPTYPCDLCDFVTNEFPALQRHRIEHRNTLVPCELCNNNIQYSLLLLTRHYMMCHSVNGQFRCDWCEFTTVDAGTFVQHIHHHNESHWKCSKCRHISLNEEDHQNHMKAHSGMFPFTCQVCGFGAAKSEFLKKHSATVHKEEAGRRNPWKAAEDTSAPANPSTNFKMFKRSCESQEAQRMSRLNNLTGTVPNQNGRLVKPDLLLEEAGYTLDGSVGKKDSRGSSKSSQNSDQSTSYMLQECDNSLSSSLGSHTNTNGLTVLMVKNKISLPPHCTTKVMGFKMVDGKKHLVLKVIPAVKQDLPTQNHSTADSACPLVLNLAMDKSKASGENGQGSDSRSSASHCLADSPTTGSCIQMDQDDIMAVKVKIEEEETSVCNFFPSPHTGDDGEQSSILLNPCLTSADMLDPVRNQLSCVGDQTHSDEIEGDNFDSKTCKTDAASCSTSEISSTTTVCDQATSLFSTSGVQETNESKSVFTKSVCGSFEGSPTDGEKSKGNGVFSSMDIIPSLLVTPEETGGISSDIKARNVQQNVNDVKPTQPCPSSSACSRDGAISTGNIPNQEVFAFHNYSKETFSTLANTIQTSDSNSEHSEDEKNPCESSEFSLTLAESPEHFTESPDVLVEYKAGVDNAPTEQHVDSELQEFNIIKIEEDSIPISTKQSKTKSSSAQSENVVEEHSDETIQQKLNKEGTEASVESSSSLKQTKTALRILQLPEGKQPVLLRTAENRFALPLQVKATPGFKLLTNSTNPQIKVSNMKPGLDQSASGLTRTPNTKVIGVPKAKPQLVEKGKTLFSAFKPGIHTTSNHYLIDSSGLKGPVFLSPHATPAEKTAKTPQMCYLVQRSVPLTQTQTTPAIKLASTPFPLNSRPVLAMPVSSAEKASTLQTGRQAFLLRYISPHKSGLLLNNQETKSGPVGNQTSESSVNKVIFKIVTPTGSILTSAAPTSNNQPLFLATRPQTKCFLVSSNKNNAAASSGIKKLLSIQNTVQRDVKSSNAPPSHVSVKLQPCEAEKLSLAPRPVRPPSQRKRRRKALFDELPVTVQKVRRLSNKVQTERETSAMWRPVAKEVERTLRLSPFSPEQRVKCPRRYQPVVVLNHPDADIPEVANIMKVVNRYEGAVTKVALCQKTVQALSDLGTVGNNSPTKNAWCASNSPRPVQSSVQERFLLKLKLRKKSKKKYEVVKMLSGGSPGSAVFDCWFCGRLFNNQEDWVGHGQRHLMEATRDWNKLF